MLHWTLYVHVDPLPALQAAWDRPEPLEPASVTGAYRLVKVEGDARTVAQLATDVEHTFHRLLDRRAIGSGEPATLLVDGLEPDVGAQWEWQIAETAGAPALYALIMRDVDAQVLDDAGA